MEGPNYGLQHYAPCKHAAWDPHHAAWVLHDLVIRQAAHKPKGSIERLLLVAAFAQSAFQAVGKLKCMVPMMGETYEVCAGIFFSMIVARQSLWHHLLMMPVCAESPCSCNPAAALMRIQCQSQCNTAGLLTHG